MRYLFLIVLLIFVGQADAMMLIAGSPPAGGAETFIATYDFEEVGTPTNIATSYGTPDFDKSTSTLEMEGDECLEINDAGYEDAVISLTTADEVWISFMLRLEDLPTTDQIWGFQNSTTQLARMYIQPDGDITVRGVNGTTSSAIARLSVDTTYYIKLRYKIGTADNDDSEIEGWVSSDGVTWGTSQTSTDGTEELQVDNFEIIQNNTDNNAEYIDNFKEKGSDIIDGR